MNRIAIWIVCACFLCTQIRAEILPVDPLDTWIKRNPSAAFPLSGVGYFDGQFIAMGMRDGIVLSKNGIEWTVLTNLPSAKYAGKSFLNLVHGNGIAVMGGIGQILSSTDGVNWTQRMDLEINVNIRVAFGGGRFIAFSQRPRGFGTEYGLWSSTNGVNWTQQPPFPISGLAYGETNFVAARWTEVATSFDGIVWRSQQTGLTNNYYSVGYGNGVFVIVGTEGAIMTSSDNGQSWILQSSGTTSQLNGVAYGGGTFLVYGSQGTILTSQDGVNWTKRETPVPTSTFFQGAVFGNETFVVTGHDLTADNSGLGRPVILQSGRLPSIVKGPGIRDVSIDRGAIRFGIWGLSNHVSRLQSSTNLVNWHDLQMITNSEPAGTWFTNQLSTNIQSQFFRIVTP